MVMVMALIYTICGRYDEAIDELESVLALGTGETVHSVNTKPWTEPLRDLPRYRDLMEAYRL